jgi:hypothetical protein
MIGPAIYKNKDVTGTIFGGYLVNGLDGHKYDVDGHKNHKLWSVTCIHCKKHFIAQAQHIINSKYGCMDCKGDFMSSKNSVHWVGGEYVPGFFVSKIKHAAIRKSRTIDFDLSFEYLDQLWTLQKGRCAYTNEELWFGRSKVSGSASLDRIDSKLGYIEGNVQFVHKDVNIMKWDLSDKRFLDICEKITKNRRVK